MQSSSVTSNQQPNSPERESARLLALDRYDVLDTPREEAFDRITRLARKMFRVPIALVSFIDAHRQWYKSCEGLADKEVPLEGTFCKRVILERKPLIVPDTTKDERFSTHPAVVGEPNIRAYAGMPLHSDDGHVIGTFCIIDTKPRFFDAEELELLSEVAAMAVGELRLRLQATTDGLTGAISRRAFRDEGARATALALRHHQDLSCVAMDLDHFKSVNDRYGHPAGDTVLKRFAELCQAALRETDLFGRFGGEEFGALLPMTSASGAIEVAEKLRAALAVEEIDLGSERVQITASFGVASLGNSTRDFEALIEHADLVLYESKARGRNCVTGWKDFPRLEGVQKRRVLKGGKILFNGRSSVIDCTVRSLSDVGAGIDVSSARGVPENFELAISGDGLEKRCRVISQSERRIEVAFA